MWLGAAIVKAGESSVARGLGHEKVLGFGQTLIPEPEEMGKSANKHNERRMMTSIDSIFPTVLLCCGELTSIPNGEFDTKIRGLKTKSHKRWDGFNFKGVY